MNRYYSKYKTYYLSGLWNDKMLRDAVEKNRLTPEEYTEITGKEY